MGGGEADAWGSMVGIAPPRWPRAAAGRRKGSVRGDIAHPSRGFKRTTRRAQQPKPRWRNPVAAACSAADVRRSGANWSNAVALFAGRIGQQQVLCEQRQASRHDLHRRSEADLARRSLFPQDREKNSP